MSFYGTDHALFAKVRTTLYSAVLCSTVQYSTVQYSAVQYNTVQYSKVHNKIIFVIPPHDAKTRDITLEFIDQISTIHLPKHFQINFAG
jgi:hypothetical protein